MVCRSVTVVSLAKRLNRSTITLDPKDIYMHCPHVTLRCIKSYLSHVVSLSTCNVFILFTFVFINECANTCLFPLLTSTCVTCYIKYQSNNHAVSVENLGGPKEPCIRWEFRSPMGWGSFKGEMGGRCKAGRFSAVSREKQLNQSRCSLGF